MDYTDYIIAPVVTEKSLSAQKENNKYVFRIRKNVNKLEIKRAVEHLYNVHVASVNTLKTVKKERMVRKGVYITKRPLCIKAIVTLKKDESLDYSKLKSKK